MNVMLCMSKFSNKDTGLQTEEQPGTKSLVYTWILDLNPPPFRNLVQCTALPLYCWTA